MKDLGFTLSLEVGDLHSVDALGCHANAIATATDSEGNILKYKAKCFFPTSTIMGLECPQIDL